MGTKVINLEELNRLIDSQEDKGDKKALLIVRSCLRKFKDKPISRKLMSNIVDARVKAEEMAGSVFIDNELDDLFEDSANTVEHLNNVVFLSFGNEEEE